MSKDVMRTMSIDTTKIDKSRLSKGKYLNMVWWEKQEEDQYGNHGFVVQSLSKQDRDSGMKGAILGNVKRWDNGGPSAAGKGAPQSGEFDEEPDDSLPF